MGRGTYEGDIGEIEFIKKFNKNKTDFLNYLKRFSNDLENVWMVRVTTKQLSKLSNQKVFTRADSYLIKVKNNILPILYKTDFYLSEDLLFNEQIEFSPISFSGISIKMTDSKNFQILKVGPHSFFTLFGSYELGAGASLFCLREDELPKNIDLINGWKTNLEAMANYFKIFTNNDINFFMNQIICKKIKNYSCEQIEKMIIDSVELQEKIFNGKDLYNEPYTAWYFSVTTGSGRSHGDYTIVLKPISH